MAKGTICKYCEHCISCIYNLGGIVITNCDLRTDFYGDSAFSEELCDCEDFELPAYDKSCWDVNGMLKIEYLPKLRSQICIGSYNLSDYNNTYGIQPEMLSDLFDDYIDWLDSNMLYESDENLLKWYEECHYWITDEFLINLDYVKSKVKSHFYANKKH